MVLKGFVNKKSIYFLTVQSFLYTTLSKEQEWDEFSPSYILVYNWLLSGLIPQPRDAEPPHVHFCVYLES